MKKCDICHTTESTEWLDYEVTKEDPMGIGSDIYSEITETVYVCKQCHEAEMLICYQTAEEEGF